MGISQLFFTGRVMMAHVLYSYVNICDFLIKHLYTMLLSFYVRLTQPYSWLIWWLKEEDRRRSWYIQKSGRIMWNVFGLNELNKWITIVFLSIRGEVNTSRAIVIFRNTHRFANKPKIPIPLKQTSLIPKIVVLLECYL